MLTNYFKVAFRNMWKQKSYSFINIAGLAIGMAISLLIFMWVLDEFSYDTFHENYDTVYQVYEKQHYSDQEVFSVTATPYPLAPALKEEFPEIIRSTRLDFYTGQNTIFKFGDNSFFENILFVDKDFLEMYSFKFSSGSADAAFENPNEVILTESVAEKYFGQNGDALGKVMKVDGEYDLVVAGVVEDVPQNSSIKFSLLGNIDFLKSLGLEKLEVWGSNSTYTYIQLAENVNPDQVSEKIRDRVKEHQANIGTEIFLHPLSELHLYNREGVDSPGRIQNVIIFSIIAIFILIIASINFINLSTARATKRFKEVGLKKVIGATRLQIARQFFGESVLLALLGLFVAVIIALLLLPEFNFITGKEMKISYLSANFYLIMGGVTIFVGLVSGIYPSLYLSKFQPVEILNERGKGKVSSTWLRTVLVIFQFSISVVLIFATIVLFKQTDYLLSQDLGFSEENVVYMNTDSEMKSKINVIKTKLGSLPSVEVVSSGLHLPSYITWNGGGWKWEGQQEGTDPLVSVSYVDNNWWKVFDIKLAAGRGFDDEIDGVEGSPKVMINETFAKMISPDGDVVGKVLNDGSSDNPYTVIGVIKDFNFLNLRREVGPLAVHNYPNDQMLFVKLNNANEKYAADQIREVLSATLTGTAPTLTFLEDELKTRFVSEKQEQTLAGYFALLTIVIASLGLFGLSAFIAEQKTKEIGIRKVLGATIRSIVSSLSVNFIKWILIANLIGLPIGYYLMGQWLQDYPYRISITADLLIIVFASSIVIAVLATGYQSIKAAVSNPVKSLRYE